MDPYVRNPKCSCARCRTRDLTGAALVVTVGILLLLHSNRIAYLGQTWPVILLVLGAFSFLGHTASTEGHIPPYAAPGVPMPQQPYGTPGAVTPQPWSPTTTSQQPQQSWEAPGTTTTSTSGEQMPPNDQQVNS